MTQLTFIDHASNAYQGWHTVDEIAGMLNMSRRNVLLHVANWKQLSGESASYFRVNTDGGSQVLAHYPANLIAYIEARKLRIDPSSRETARLHPLVSSLLIRNGYDIESEVPMPVLGRADFVARGNGEVLVVEAKRYLKEPAIYQVLAYAHQTGYTPVLATYAPANAHYIGKCDQLNIRVIQIPRSKKDS